MKILIFLGALGMLIWTAFLPGYLAVITFLIGICLLLYDILVLIDPKHKKPYNELTKQELENIDYIP